MPHNLLFFDIETVPDDKLDISLGVPAKLGNLKDKKKVLAKQKEWIDDGQIKAHSVSPFHNKIVALEMYHLCSDGFFLVKPISHFDKTEIEDPSEKGLLTLFHQWCRNSDYIIGFNILNFDLPTIMFRSAMLGIKSHPISLKRYSTKPVVDLMQLLQCWETDKKKWKSLDWYSKRFGLKTQKSSDGSEIYEWYKKGEMDKIRQHCRDDVTITKELFHRVCEVYTPEILLF